VFVSESSVYLVVIGWNYCYFSGGRSGIHCQHPGVQDNQASLQYSFGFGDGDGLYGECPGLHDNQASLVIDLEGEGQLFFVRVNIGFLKGFCWFSATTMAFLANGLALCLF
jgi:hypothetical protein